jgi:hypothetical protein
VKLFRDLDVTRRYTLKLFSDGLIIMVGLSVLVFHHRNFRALENEGFREHQNGPSEVVYRIRETASNLILVRQAWALTPISRLKNGRRNEAEKGTKLT